MTYEFGPRSRREAKVRAKVTVQAGWKLTDGADTVIGYIGSEFGGDILDVVKSLSTARVVNLYLLEGHRVRVLNGKVLTDNVYNPIDDSSDWVKTLKIIYNDFVPVDFDDHGNIIWRGESFTPPQFIKAYTATGDELTLDIGSRRESIWRIERDDVHVVVEIPSTEHTSKPLNMLIEISEKDPETTYSLRGLDGVRAYALGGKFMSINNYTHLFPTYTAEYAEYHRAREIIFNLALPAALTPDDKIIIWGDAYSRSEFIKRFGVAEEILDTDYSIQLSPCRLWRLADSNDVTIKYFGHWEKDPILTALEISKSRPKETLTLYCAGCVAAVIRNGENHIKYPPRGNDVVTELMRKEIVVEIDSTYRVIWEYEVIDDSEIFRLYKSED